MKTKPKQNNQNMTAIERIFNSLDLQSRGWIFKKDLEQGLADRGILLDDVRIRQTADQLKKLKADEKVNAVIFAKLVRPHITLIEKALTGNLVIPDFKNFSSFIINLYNRTIQNEEGSVSGEIPELANANPNQYALSICTVDGQRFNIGDYRASYLARSTAKFLNYCLAFEDQDQQTIYKSIGYGPKESEIDHIMLNKNGLPHNPFTNSGALMIASMLYPKLAEKVRFEKVKKLWKEMSGNISCGWNSNAFSSEKKNAGYDRALAYFMQKKGLLPKGSVDKHLEFLWQCQNIETTTEAQAVIGATLANAGACPTNEKDVLKPNIARNCLSAMALAGMNEYSSEYNFSIGLPATSGNSGVVVIVVPDVMGIAVWSPRVDGNGNGMKGLDFSRKFIERFNFHAFDSKIKNINKIDPRLKKNEIKMKSVMALTSAASIGDVDELNRLYSVGVDLNEGEYDKRTGIHLAASEGHLEAVKFFIEKNADINPKDRWGGTPITDAKRGGHKKVFELLKKHGGRES